MITGFGQELFAGLKSLALHIQVNFDISVSRFDAGMSQTGSDHV